MKILIVHAHENPESFCSAMKDTLVAAAKQTGHEVVVSDLYAMKFNPVASSSDFKELSGAPYYKFQAEQKTASEQNTFTTEVQTEMDKLLWCDLLIFSYPIWWFSMPAILKGWVDRIMAFGFSYGGPYGVYEKGRFRSKSGACFVTTGGPAAMYQSDAAHRLSAEQLMHPVQHNIFFFNGINPLPTFFAFSVARLTDEERKSQLEKTADQLTKIIECAEENKTKA